jgi:hypothetical protein
MKKTRQYGFDSRIKLTKDGNPVHPLYQSKTSISWKVFLIKAILKILQFALCHIQKEKALKRNSRR